MEKKPSRKVVVAMSGGVDSSVAAALLKEAGFNLIGVFMNLWSLPDANGLAGKRNKCCSSEAEKRARRVAQVLGIPFYLFNFEKEFKRRIVDYFLAEYKAGRTPNPCVVCNKKIKFGLLLDKALALGADFLATGHYARLCRTSPGLKGKDQMVRLLRAKDEKKDQSYFLWQLNQKQLKHLLFPIGDYTKEEVRALAKKFGLPTARIKDSQEICFVKNTTEDFLQKYLKEKPGDIVVCDKFYKNCEHNNRKVIKRDKKYDRVVGKHKGFWFYTIGQRKGIGLSGGPYYVVGKNTEKNLLIVSKEEKDLEKKEIFIEDVNWLAGKPPELPLKARVKIRYRASFALATILSLPKTRGREFLPKIPQKNKCCKIIFSRPQRAITPGQSAVFYNQDELLGGGIIC